MFNRYTFAEANYTIIQSIIQLSMDRRLWTTEEDQHIIKLVARFGTKKWPIISERLCAETQFERTGKQCRQRWYNHLNPEINSTVWSEQDQERLFEAHKQYGNKWKIISKMFVGRTDNSIKNHFYSTIRRCLRRINKLQGQKNSTLKMRTIKPYVLSKILADRNLTETILQLGKIKPNKSRRELKFQYLEEFNEMINKLYEINKEYETLKNNKKQSNEEKNKEKKSSKSIQEPSISNEEDELIEQEQNQEEEQESPKKEDRTTLNLISRDIEDTIKLQSLKVEQMQTIKRRKSNKNIKSQPSTPFQEYKQIKLSEPKDPFSTKRSRKSINYMKLNEGILCENDRQPEMNEQTHQDSDYAKKKIDCIGSEDHLSLDEKFFGEQKLSEIIEEEEKSNEKDNIQNNQNIFHHDLIDIKGSRHFQISNPSPCFSKSSNFFDDLVVIGTHMKILTTPRDEKRVQEDRILQEYERKQSEQDFIEQILEINFDPDFALKYGAEEQQKQ